MNTKICARCGEAKEHSEFYKQSRNKDGLHSYCKKCNQEKSALYHKTEKGIESSRKALAKAADKGYYRWGAGAIPRLRQGALKRGIPFDLTAEQLEAWWKNNPDKCYYCKMDIEDYLKIRDYILEYQGTNYAILKFNRFFRSPKHKSISNMTIDRVDNNLGYAVSNMVKSCWICNSLKGDFLSGDLMQIIAPAVIDELTVNIARELANEEPGRFHGQ